MVMVTLDKRPLSQPVLYTWYKDCMDIQYHYMFNATISRKLSSCQNTYVKRITFIIKIDIKAREIVWIAWVKILISLKEIYPELSSCILGKRHINIGVNIWSIRSMAVTASLDTNIRQTGWDKIWLVLRSKSKGFYFPQMSRLERVQPILIYVRLSVAL